MFEHPLPVPRSLYDKARFISQALVDQVLEALCSSISSFQAFAETGIEVFCFTADDVDVEH